jgi:outer membrane protein OmpA-like peptidoglycan-associated protein
MRRERNQARRARRHPSALAGLLVTSSAALLAACAGPSSESLDEAQRAVAAARADQEVVAQAPEELAEAEEALNQAQSAFRDGADQDEVDHLAYVAEQRAGTAQALADERVALAEVERLGEERHVESRDRQIRVLETELAEQRAGTAQARADERVALAEIERLDEERDDLLVESRDRQIRMLETDLAELRVDRTERGLVVTLSDEILFDVDQAELKPGGMEQLARVAEVLGQNPDRNVLIEGHTDSTAPDADNLELSQRRANAVEDFLITQGMDPTRMSAAGYGEQLPIASNDTTAGRQANRRVDLVVLDAGEPIPPPRAALQ